MASCVLLLLRDEMDSLYDAFRECCLLLHPDDLFIYMDVAKYLDKQVESYRQQLDDWLAIHCFGCEHAEFTLLLNFNSPW